MSRLRIFAILASLLALSAALAACGSSSSSNSENPQKVVNEATLKGIKSANLDLSLGVKVEGSEGGNLNVSLSGPFQSEAKGQLPQLDMTAKATGSINGKNVDFEGGLTLLSEKAYVDYKGTEYEVEPTTFSFIRSTIERDQQKNGAQSKSASTSACQEAVSEPEGRQLHRQSHQRRQFRSRRDEHDAGQRRPQRPGGDRRAAQAQRNPCLQRRAWRDRSDPSDG